MAVAPPPIYNLPLVGGGSSRSRRDSHSQSQSNSYGQSQSQAQAQYGYANAYANYAQSERAVTVRRPSSISSRSSANHNPHRRHRGHPSHAGGSSGYAPQNEFPNFALSGDVEIIINADGQERRYLLHRLILAQNSGFFEASMSEQWARAKAHEYAGHSGALIGSGEAEGGNVRGSLEKSRAQVARTTWRYELDWGPEGHSDDIPMLVQKVREMLFASIRHTEHE